MNADFQKGEKRVLKILRTSGPEWFNALKVSDKFIIFQCVFNEYVRKVAIPKQWEFTKTIKEWPATVVDEETDKLLQKVSQYPDLILYAMENYGLVVDSLDENDEDDAKEMKEKGIPGSWALGFYKVSKSEALSFCNTIRKEFQEEYENRPKSKKWDEEELSEDNAFRAIDNYHNLSRGEKLRLSAYITYKFAKKVGIPISQWDKELETHVKKALDENGWTINEAWKRKGEFLWFCLWHYGMAPSFGRNKNGEITMGMIKVPDEVLDTMTKILKSGRDFTEEDWKIFAEDILKSDKEKSDKEATESS